MALNARDPAPLAGGNRVGTHVQAGWLNTAEDTSLVRLCQSLLLIRRFGLTPSRARIVAELAFRKGGEA